jgi:hypothetical protein
VVGDAIAVRLPNAGQAWYSQGLHTEEVIVVVFGVPVCNRVLEPQLPGQRAGGLILIPHLRLDIVADEACGALPAERAEVGSGAGEGGGVTNIDSSAVGRGAAASVLSTTEAQHLRQLLTRSRRSSLSLVTTEARPSRDPLPV